MLVSQGLCLDVLHKLPEGGQLLHPGPPLGLQGRAKVVACREEGLPEPLPGLLSVLGHNFFAMEVVIVAGFPTTI